MNCHLKHEEYPNMLLTYHHWCPQCRENPEEILTKLLLQLGVNIIDKNVKKIIDYKVEKDGKIAFIYIKRSENDAVDKLTEMAIKASIKLIIVPVDIIVKNEQSLLVFISNALQSVENLIIVYSEQSTPEIVLPKLQLNNSELSEQELIDKLLLEAGYERDQLIMIGLDTNSYVSRPIPGPKDVKLAVGYCRVSTKMQLEGHSIAAQVSAIKNYCQYEKLHLSCVYFDLALSGRSNNRPGLKELMSKLQPTQTIIVASLSRLARNLKNSLELLEEIQQKQGTLALLDLKVNTESALGKMLFTLVASLAEFEAKQTGERISNVMTNMRDNNLLKPRPPYGWEHNGKGNEWLKVEKEQNMIEYIRNLRVTQPDLTVSQICRHLNRLKDPCLRSKTKKWYESSLLRLLYNNKIPIPKGDEHKKLAEIYSLESTQ
jgi:site-specific DNA recombinase